LPALNRYFGVFEDGATIKTRGIELRRHDTPPLFAKFQEELLQKMNFADNIDDIKKMIPRLEEIYIKYRDLIYYKKFTFLNLYLPREFLKIVLNISIIEIQLKVVLFNSSLITENHYLQGKKLNILLQTSIIKTIYKELFL